MCAQIRRSWSNRTDTFIAAAQFLAPRRSSHLELTAELATDPRMRRGDTSLPALKVGNLFPRDGVPAANRLPSPSRRLFPSLSSCGYKRAQLSQAPQES